MRTVRFELLRPDEVLAERSRCPVVYQPIGPLEWHGPHMPFGMDPLHAEAIARRVAESIGGVVMPTLFWGAERELSPEALRNIGFEEDKWIIGMDYPANKMPSMYSQEDIFGLVVRGRLELIVKQGYRLIVIVNGHGACNHMETLARLAAEFTAQSPSRVMFITAFKPDLAEGRYSGIGHADAVETSILMALHPDSVDLSTLPMLPEPLRNVDWGIVDGPTFAGNPNADRTLAESADPRRHASAERGERIMAETTLWIGEQIQTALRGIEAKR
jgi:creatinine amidohydrolase